MRTRGTGSYSRHSPGGTKRNITTKRSEEEGWAWVAEMEQVYGGDEPAAFGAQTIARTFGIQYIEPAPPRPERGTPPLDAPGDQGQEAGSAVLTAPALVA